MALDAINEIKAAEEKAKKIIEEAKNDAERLIDNTRELAKKAEEDLSFRLKNEWAERKAEIEKETKEKLSVTLDKVNKEIKEKEERILNEKDEIISKVIDKLFS